MGKMGKMARKQSALPDIAVSEWSQNSRIRRYMTAMLLGFCYLLVILTSPFSLLFVMKSIPQYQRAVVLGSTLSSAKTRGPGLVFVLPFMEHIRLIDIRTKVYEIPPQQILSTDSVTLTVDAVIYYRVFDPVKAACRLANYNESVCCLASATLGSILGTYRLSQLLSERDIIATKVQATFKEATDPWGITVERVEVKNLCVAKEMVKSMAIEAQANREANGLLIIQKGEEKCLSKIKLAAEEMKMSPTSIVLKYLQTLNHISATHNHTVVLPVPKIKILS